MQMQMHMQMNYFQPIEFESEEKNRETQPSAVDQSAELHATPGKNVLVTCYMFTVYVIIFLLNFTFPGYARLNKYICASNENPCTRECIEATINLILITERNLCS